MLVIDNLLQTFRTIDHAVLVYQVALHKPSREN